MTKLKIKVMSFGYKYEKNPTANILFDVRYLDNPYWDESMRTKTGLDKEVSDYVMSVDGAQDSLIMYENVALKTLPRFKKKMDEKELQNLPFINEVVIAFGCTGGQHRSVVFAQKMYEYLKNNGYNVEIEHRDMEKSLKAAEKKFNINK